MKLLGALLIGANYYFEEKCLYRVLLAHRNSLSEIQNHFLRIILSTNLANKIIIIGHDLI